VNEEFRLAHEQIRKSRITDFRILFGIGMTTAFVTLGLVIRALGLF
jgi:hypothetical protein